jgi:hypothetical protein
MIDTRLGAAVLASKPLGHTTIPCHFCGQMTEHVNTDFAEGIVRMLNADPWKMYGFRGPNNWSTNGAMCDDCYEADNERVRNEAAAQQYDADLLLAASGAPTLPKPDHFQRCLLDVVHGESLGAYVIAPDEARTTSQLSELVRQWCNVRALPVQYVTEREMVRDLSNFQHHDHNTRLGKYQRVQLLVIDEVAERKRTDWTEAIWGDVLEPRHRNGRATVLASRKRPDEVRSWTQAIRRRVHEMCGEPVEVMR